MSGSGQLKRGPLAQAQRDAFTEEVSFGIIQDWANRVIPALAAVQQNASQLHQTQVDSMRASVGSISSANAAQQQQFIAQLCAQSPPQGVVDVLRAYQDLCYDVFSGMEKIRTVITIRIPEHKEEDNLGVAVQMAVLKTLAEVEAKATGSSGEKSGAALGGFGLLSTYLGSRVSLEEKLLSGASDESKDKAASPSDAAAKEPKSKSPSLILQVQQLDADTVKKVELAAMQLTTSLRAMVNAYVLNWKKLIQPRTSSEKMLS